MRALDCPLGDVTRLSAGGGALPAIMSIIGPRETHAYRNYNLLVRGTNTSPKKKTKKKHVSEQVTAQHERAQFTRLLSSAQHWPLLAMPPHKPAQTFSTVHCLRFPPPRSPLFLSFFFFFFFSFFLFFFLARLADDRQ